MKKTMFEVSVYTTDDGNIAIQAPSGCEECETVVISPGQVEALSELLREARAELVSMRRD